MDAVTCKLFASLCIWTYVLIECSNGVPFNSFLSDEKFTRETGDEDLEQNEQRIREEDLRKLILKKLRFRDLEGLTYPKAFDGVSAKYYEISPDGAEVNERKRSSNINHEFVNKVAALLSGLKPRQLDSPKVRMSSLRFGR